MSKYTPRIMLVVTQSTNVIHLQGQSWRETPASISPYVPSAYSIKVKPNAGNAKQVQKKQV